MAETIASTHTSDGWRLKRIRGVTLVCCEAFRAAGLLHAFSTRQADGAPHFDMGSTGPVPLQVQQRRARFLKAAGFCATVPTILRQTHGCRILRASEVDEDTEADGVVWLSGDPPVPVPSVRTADCVPVLLLERSGAAAAALHAGWRGTAEGIAGRAVAGLVRLGVAAERLQAALGPSIGGCCYVVGPEVAAAVVSRCGGSAAPSASPVARHLDLREANRRQLERAGVPAESIHVAHWCTACRSDLFFSYRREGPTAGRMMASIGPLS